MSRRPNAGGKGKPGKSELTEEQKQEIREAFDLFDTDGSGARHRERRTRTRSHVRVTPHPLTGLAAPPSLGTADVLARCGRHYRCQGAQGGDARARL